MIAGKLDYDRGMNEETLDQIISLGKDEGFNLERGETIIKLSGTPQIPSEIIFTLRIVGEVVGVWIANKFLDAFWEKIKRLVKKSKEKTGISPIVQIKGNRDILVNLHLEDSSNLDDSINKLKDYLNDNPKTKGWQWYNEDLKEWGDIDKVMEWKQIKNNNQNDE